MTNETMTKYLFRFVLGAYLLVTAVALFGTARILDTLRNPPPARAPQPSLYYAAFWDLKPLPLLAGVEDWNYGRCVHLTHINGTGIAALWGPKQPLYVYSHRHGRHLWGWQWPNHFRAFRG